MIKKYAIGFILLVWLSGPVRLWAQDVRTLNTKVADALAMLPVADEPAAQQVFQQILKTGDEGLKLVVDQIQPNGNPEGVSARFAVSLLTYRAKSHADKAMIEKAYLHGLSKSASAEVKAYFISNLRLIGSDAAVKDLSHYISDKDLSDAAIETLVTIGTLNAGEAMLGAVPHSTQTTYLRLIKALGEMRYQPAMLVILEAASSTDLALRKQALWSMALLADVGSYEFLGTMAKNAGFRNDPSEAMVALIEFQRQTALFGNVPLVQLITQNILANTPVAAQQHFRLAALDNLAMVDHQGVNSLLIKERTRFDAAYRRGILRIAALTASDEAAIEQWTKEYKKSTGEEQAELLTLLSSLHHDDNFTETVLVPALASANAQVRMVAADEIGKYRNNKFIAPMVGYLVKYNDDVEMQHAKVALLQLVDKDNCSYITIKMGTAPAKSKVVMLQILAERRAVRNFEDVASLCNAKDAEVKDAAYEALAKVSSPPWQWMLIKMLLASNDPKEIKALQTAIIAGLNNRSAAQINEAYQRDKIKLLPILGFLREREALEKVKSVFYEGNPNEKEIAFNTLCSWSNEDACRTLLAIRMNASLKDYHERAFKSFISQVSQSSWSDDQKLLMLKEIMPAATTSQEKVSVLRAVGGLRSFLSLVFVSNYLDDAEVSGAASRAAMQIALPTADAKPGLDGVVVKGILQKVLNKLTGPDSQYDRIDIATYLEKMPRTKGYEPIFNGKDLAGWKGLVENPIARGKMKKEVLAAKQKASDAKVGQSWTVRDGAIWFSGTGDNLCTTRTYGDFEMFVDWKISKNGDSGIYLRGTPQIQIWDNARIDVGAQVGSGGLYNNQKEMSKPLVVADNPVGEWNTFRITMIGERVTVYLNGILVVDNVKMENYWDRNIPIFSEEAIELQAHGTELGFRNIYVKELSHKAAALSKAEQDQGFQLLFNGKDLNNWVGNKTDYVVEDADLAIYPANGGKGNLYTEKEYTDFVFRFEFQLTPGANNGLGIHAPLEGDAAYLGKEIQILDNTAPVYASLEPYQYHGSVYGVIPARREFLKPVGDWNDEEVYVKGDYIKVTLNGTVITEGDLKKASSKGTMDKKDHPGLSRHTGHIGFLGHGAILKFRNIRVRELTK